VGSWYICNLLIWIIVINLQIVFINFFILNIIYKPKLYTSIIYRYISKNMMIHVAVQLLWTKEKPKYVTATLFLNWCCLMILNSIPIKEFWSIRHIIARDMSSTEFWNLLALDLNLSQFSIGYPVIVLWLWSYKFCLHLHIW
jgi:hypothetical protein